MKAKLFAAAAAAAGLMWMASGLATNDRSAGADSSRTSTYAASTDTSRARSSSPDNHSSKTDRRDGSESMTTGMGMMEGIKNMMGRMMSGGTMSGGTMSGGTMSGGTMSGGMMDGCPMMGSSQPNKQWRDGGSAR